jgi:hypothetical protein
MAMIRDDGDSPRGETPPAEYVDALESTNPGERDRINEVCERHREGRGPPEWAGGPSRGAGNSQGGNN